MPVGLFLKKLSKEEQEYYNGFQPEEQELIILVKEDCGGASIRGAFMTPSVRFVASIDPKNNELKQKEGILSWIIPQNNKNSKWGYEFKKMNIYQVRVRKCYEKKLEEYQNEIVNRKYLVVKVLKHIKSEPRLDNIREKYLKPVYIDDGVLGRFTLDRKYGWFEGSVDWLGYTPDIQLEVDENNDSTAKRAFEAFKNVSSSIGEWDEKVRRYAAEELTELAIDWNEDGDSNNQITETEFAKRIEITSIIFHGDGSFEFTFNDDDMFFGHWVVVYVDEQGVFERADIEG